MEQHFNTLDHQDWKTIIIKKPKENVKNSKKKVNNDSQKKISVEKKAEEGDLKQKKITLELRQDIMKARTAKSLTSLICISIVPIRDSPNGLFGLETLYVI